MVLAGGIPPGGAVRAVKDGGAKLIAFAPAFVLAKRLVRSGRGRAGDRGIGGRRPYRAGVADRARAGDPAVYPATCRCSSPADSDAARRSSRTWKWGLRARSSGRGSRRRPRASRTRRSNRRSFVPMPATRCRRSSSTSGSRSSRCAASSMPARSGSSSIRPRRWGSYQSGELTKDAAQLSIEHFWAGALRRAVIDGDVRPGSVHGRAVRRAWSLRFSRPRRSLPELVDQAVAALVARRQQTRLVRLGARADVDAAPPARSASRPDGAGGGLVA